jgi:lipopolysaccharide assembly protein A
MRVLYFLILLLLVGAVGVFAVQNRELVSVEYLNWTVTFPLALLIGIGYVLGMLSGWSVVGFAQRSVRGVTDRPPR